MTDNVPENEVQEVAKTTSSADYILEVPPPSLVLDASEPRQVTVHWSNSGGENENALPDGAVGCEIQFAHGGSPIDVNIWTVLETSTESPAVHNITATTPPNSWAYRARYVGKDQKCSPYSTPAICTVSE